MIQTSKICSKCSIRSVFSKYSKYCSECRQIRDEELAAHEREYGKQYYYANRAKFIERIVQNKERTKIIRNSYQNTRRKADPFFRLRDRFSTAIRVSLNKRGSSKCGLSILKILPYSIQELKDHLESQFESWMTWENYGRYEVKTWNDSDPTTWTWQIDHIISQSTFQYTSMEDKKFQECWALNNLQPLSSKVNLLKGNK